MCCQDAIKCQRNLDVFKLSCCQFCCKDLDGHIDASLFYEEQSFYCFRWPWRDTRKIERHYPSECINARDLRVSRRKPCPFLDPKNISPGVYVCVRRYRRANEITGPGNLPRSKSIASGANGEERPPRARTCVPVVHRSDRGEWQGGARSLSFSPFTYWRCLI